MLEFAKARINHLFCFENSLKSKSQNLSTFYVYFTDKHVVFGNYFFIYFFKCVSNKKGQFLYFIFKCTFTQNQYKSNVNKLRLNNTIN